LPRARISFEYCVYAGSAE